MLFRRSLALVGLFVAFLMAKERSIERCRDLLLLTALVAGGSLAALSALFAFSGSIVEVSSFALGTIEVSAVVALWFFFMRHPDELIGIYSEKSIYNGTLLFWLFAGPGFVAQWLVLVSTGGFGADRLWASGFLAYAVYESWCAVRNMFVHDDPAPRPRLGMIVWHLVTTFTLSYLVVVDVLGEDRKGGDLFTTFMLGAILFDVLAFGALLYLAFKKSVPLLDALAGNFSGEQARDSDLVILTAGAIGVYVVYEVVDVMSPSKLLVIGMVLPYVLAAVKRMGASRYRGRSPKGHR